MSHATLRSATTSTFEELALLPAVPDDGRAADRAPLAGGVRVAFTGPLSGVLTVHVTRALLGAVATNMLGRELRSADPLCRDALGELANVLCGSLLPALAGRRAEFRLLPPEWLGAGDEDDDPAIGRAGLVVEVALEVGRAEVTLCLSDGPLPAPAARRR